MPANFWDRTLGLISDPQAWLAFLTLAMLEVLLGIDNVIFVSILVMRLPPPRRDLARVVGLGLAMLTRIALLLSIFSLTQQVQPWFELLGRPIAARDVVLFLGGLFLLSKAVLELHHSLEAKVPTQLRAPAGLGGRFASTVIQIALLDIVFSLDSVLTAVGLVRDLSIMIAAIIVAILVMLWVSRPVGSFIERHPTIKTLALAFLILIGMALISSALHFEIPKGYLYFAMAFSMAVELINIRVRRVLQSRRRPGDDEGV